MALPNRYPPTTEFRLLGPLEVVRGTEHVALGGLRRRSTLAILLLNACRVVSIDRLADDLYAGEPPASAVTQVHRQVSELRRLLPEAQLDTVAPGYVLRVEPRRVDLHRFEQLLERGVERLELGDAAEASQHLRDALGLWRGEPLADLSDQPFAQPAIARLGELRLAATERLFEAELELGRAAEVVSELQTLLHEQPLRERVVELLMTALYRTGRQADALAVFRAHRLLVANQLGLEPGPALRRLEAAILRQEPGLTSVTRVEAEPAASPVVLAAAVGREPSSTSAALAGGDRRETILLHIVDEEAELANAASSLERRRRDHIRVATFVSGAWQADVVRFAAAQNAALVLVDADDDVTDALPTVLLQRATSDVALVVRGSVVPNGPIYVPFGGGDHDWAALELAAAVSRVSSDDIRLVGTGASPGARDASRLLADASLALQRAFGVTGSPVLVPATPEAVLALVEDAGLVVAGIGSRWRTEGIGPVRSAIVARAQAPVALVHRGPRPGILAPRAARTRYTWSLQN